MTQQDFAKHDQIQQWTSEALFNAGFHSCDFGVDLLSSECREHVCVPRFKHRPLKYDAFCLFLRHLPDLIVFGETSLFLCEIKSGACLEEECLRVLRWIYDFFRTHVFVVTGSDHGLEAAWIWNIIPSGVSVPDQGIRASGPSGDPHFKPANSERWTSSKAYVPWPLFLPELKGLDGRS